jgi:hypothetical protein
MKPSRKSANPFYALLVVIGIVFVVTACSYGTMAVREAHGNTLVYPESADTLMLWMAEHGNTALLVELALLGVCTFGAIATDEYWQRRAQPRNKNQ